MKGRCMWLGDPSIRAKMEQRRRQILVHSIIYYVMNDNIISDATWSKWAAELEALQRKYPDIARTSVYADAFSQFNGSTGCNLPLDDEWGNNKARQLLAMRDRRN